MKDLGQVGVSSSVRQDVTNPFDTRFRAIDQDDFGERSISDELFDCRGVQEFRRGAAADKRDLGDAICTH
jgi:hypothetical protein